LNGSGGARAIIDSVVALGPNARLDLAYDGFHLEALVDRDTLAELGLAAGQPCAISIARAHVFKAD
jgi:hypothetical protein